MPIVFSKLILIILVFIFECIDRGEAIYSVRVGLRYRAVGIMEDGVMLWFFIGSHEDYNNLL